MLRLPHFAAAAAAALLVAGGWVGGAEAHPVFTQPQATAGAHWAGAIRLGHGCKGGLATTSLRVEIPAAILVARPQPKPGWTVAIEHAPLDAPITQEGRTLTERVSAITWTGQLPDDQFDEFAIAAKLPDEAGRLAFPVVQTCGAVSQRWDQPVEPDAPRPEFPAPALVLMPGGEHAGH
jgi:uncharacterized protein YcnI